MSLDLSADNHWKMIGIDVAGGRLRNQFVQSIRIFNATRLDAKLN